VTPSHWILYDRGFAPYAQGVADAHAWIIPATAIRCSSGWWALRKTAPVFTTKGPATLEELRDMGPPPGTWPRYTPAFVMALACWFPSGAVADALGMGRRNVERICRMLGPDAVVHLPKFAHRRIYANYRSKA
jgi:hypothetical protein